MAEDARCPSCGEESPLLETTIRKHTAISAFCNVCGQSAVVPRPDREQSPPKQAPDTDIFPIGKIAHPVALLTGQSRE